MSRLNNAQITSHFRNVPGLRPMGSTITAMDPFMQGNGRGKSITYSAFPEVFDDAWAAGFLVSRYSSHPVLGDGRDPS
jgi:hypothetical protein